MGAVYLVTGGAGFIGSNMCHTLLEQGKSVRILDDFSTGRRVNIEGIASDIDIVEGSLCNDDDVKKATKDVQHVIHQAAVPSVMRSVKDPFTSHDVNITGTLKLLLSARDSGAERVVFASSSSVYGDTPTLPKHEDMKPEPLSPYALSKLAGEHYGRMFTELYGLECFSLRYFNVFGPRQDPTSDYAAVIPLFISALQSGKTPTIYGDGEQTRDFTYVTDVVKAIQCCLDADSEAAGGVYNVAWGNRVSVNQLLHAIARIVGVEAKPNYEAARPGEIRDSQADSTRAATLLGWTPEVPFEEGLRRTVDWFTA